MIEYLRMEAPIVPKTEFISRLLNRKNKVNREYVENYLLELAQERDFLKNLFDRMSEGVLALLHDGRILFGNSAALAFLGLRLQDVLGTNILRSLNQPELAALLEESLERSERMVDKEVLVQYPALRLLNVNAFPVSRILEDEEGLLVLLQDITDTRARIEDQRRLEKLMSIGHMAAGMAHEIRNPLNSLSLRIQLLKRTLKQLEHTEYKALSDSIEDDVRVIQEEIERLNQVVERVLAASVSVPKKMEEIDPGRLLLSLERTIRPECEEAGIELIVKKSDLPDVKLWGDENALRQAFLNLTKNALHATKREDSLIVGTRKNREQLCIYFKDTGRGMSEEELSKIFEPYYTTRANGSGLGLVIVERIIQNHGGVVEVESQEGKGTEFRVCLPIYLGQPLMLEMKEGD